LLTPEKLNYAFALQAFIRQELNVSNDPFLQSYFDNHADLEAGRSIQGLAPGACNTQAKAVEIVETRREELEEAAAAGGPHAGDGIYQVAVDLDRRELYGFSEEAP
jgi:hypothetical protein